MTLSAVLLARVLVFLDINDLNPRGNLFFPAIVQQIVERFDFSKFPQKLEEFDEEKGVEFTGGYIDGTTVDKLTIWRNGIGLDVRSSTEHGAKILTDSLQWLNETAGLSYDKTKIVRWGYVSQLTFHSDLDLLALHPSIERLCARIGPYIEGPKEYVFRPASLAMTFDRYMNPWTQAPFAIQRRAEVPFEQNKYFSEAPLPTATHIELLEFFEADLRKENEGR